MGKMNIETLDHKRAILQIINDHFDLAETRVEEIYTAHFSSIGAVLKRHWCHKGDIPSDLIALPKHTWNFVAKKISKNVQTKEFPKTGKVREVEKIIAEQLLDLPGLEKKIEKYVHSCQERFELEFADILGQVPSLRREQFARELELQVARLQTPIEGVREAAVFLVVGIVGKIYSEKITFGSSIATGKVVVTSVYLSQLSWFGSLWAGIFGVPAWVGFAGMGAGMFAAIVVVPFLTPLFEIGINRFRARKILQSSVGAARNKLTGSGPDAFDVAGKTAIYLQVLPDLIEIGKNTAKAFL